MESIFPFSKSEIEKRKHQWELNHPPILRHLTDHPKKKEKIMLTIIVKLMATKENGKSNSSTSSTAAKSSEISKIQKGENMIMKQRLGITIAKIVPLGKLDH